MIAFEGKRTLLDEGKTEQKSREPDFDGHEGRGHKTSKERRGHEGVSNGSWPQQ